MPRLTHFLPKSFKHKASGQASVTLNGRVFYLGPHGTKASKTEYDRYIAEWISNDRRIVTKSTDTTITELIAAYWKFAQVHYRKGGETRRLLAESVASASLFLPAEIGVE